MLSVEMMAVRLTTDLNHTLASRSISEFTHAADQTMHLVGAYSDAYTLCDRGVDPGDEVEKDKAEWCREFAELLLKSGKWKDVHTVVWLAAASYESAKLLTAAQALQALGGVGESMVRDQPPKKD